MPIGPISSNAPGGITANPLGASLGKQEFLQLLVMQLRSQDPMNPMNDREFIAQLAQLSSLEATSNLATQMQQLVASDRTSRALQLVGHEVDYADASGQTSHGRVTGVRLDGEIPTLLVGDQEVTMDRIEMVR